MPFSSYKDKGSGFENSDVGIGMSSANSPPDAILQVIATTDSTIVAGAVMSLLLYDSGQ